MKITYAIVVQMLMLLHIQLDPQEVNCVAENIYFEARGEPLEGQIAVAEVTRNRATRLPNGTFLPYCATVYAPSQFSWTSTQPLPQINDPVAFETSVRIAAMVMSNTVKFDTVSDHYLNKKRRHQPRWAHLYEPTHRIGDHWFYASK